MACRIQVFFVVFEIISYNMMKKRFSHGKDSAAFRRLIEIVYMRRDMTLIRNIKGNLHNVINFRIIYVSMAAHYICSRKHC